jgi:probable HAF family extracellular repeat protein
VGGDSLSQALAGYLYSNGQFLALNYPIPGHGGTGINDSSVVVGGVGSDGFVYQNGALTLLSVPGAYATGAAGIDDLGQVVGAFFDNTGSHGFLYQNGVYCIMSLAGSTANGINDYGQIVGTYFTPNDMDILRFGLGACGRNIYGSETKHWLRRREARGLSRNFPPLARRY